jgi:hypothetical protein
VSSLLPNCTDCLFCQSLQQLLATNQQAKARSQQEQASVSTAEAMRQTTLTQCFNPPVPVAAPVAPPAPSGYRFFDGPEGQQYLINDTTRHLVLVPPGPPAPPAAAAPSQMAQTMSPIDLSRDSFEESVVTPSVTKKRPAVNITTSQVVLSENNGSDEEIYYVARRRKKGTRKTRKTPPSVPTASEVEVIEEQVIEQVDTQVLPQTGHFGEHSPPNNDDGNNEETDTDAESEERSVNLLAEDAEEDSEDS